MISLKTKILRVSPGKYVWGEDGRDIEHPGGPGGMYDIWQGDGMYIKVWTYKKQKVKQLFVRAIESEPYFDFPKLDQYMISCT